MSDKNKKDPSEIVPGDILKTSWGYNMTINNYCKVLENNGKTLKCVTISLHVENDNGLGNGRSIPVPDKEISEPFRIRIQRRENDFYLVGSYPFIKDKNSKRKGYWYVWDGKPDYYNTYD
jgi:hypothetical protein